MQKHPIKTLNLELAAKGKPAVQSVCCLVEALYIEALNAVIDLHSERVIAVTTTRSSPALWVTIYVMALLTMFLVGLYNSIHGRRNLVAALVLVLVFAAVLLMLVDLDRPQEGLFQVNPQAMLDLQRQINAPAP
jgi:hypothetical protein